MTSLLPLPDLRLCPCHCLQIILPSPSSVEPVRGPGARARQSIPSLSPSLLDTLSGVEVQFFRPSLGAATGDLDAGFEAGGEEEDLIRRLRDELKLEEKVNARNEASTSRWDQRLEHLKGVVAGGSAPAPERTGGIGTPPDLGELERQLQRRRLRRERRGKHEGDVSSDDDEDDNSSTSTSTEGDSDAEDSEEKSEPGDSAAK